MLKVIWYRINLDIEDMDIVYLRFILEGYDNLCFLDKCSRKNSQLSIYVTGFFLKDTRKLLEDLALTSSAFVLSVEKVDESSIKLKYY